MVINIPKDIKNWSAISCPTKGLRFDVRTLELLDANGDGRIRTDEVLAALAFLRDHGVSPDSLGGDASEAEKALLENLAQQADIENLEPSEREKAALADWQNRGNDPLILPCGEATGSAEAALAAVEPIVDAFFTPPDDMPLVTDDPDRVLPLRTRLNPRNLEAMIAFADRCVTPIVGAREELTRLEWTAVRNAFAPYRAWRASKPVVHADKKQALVEEERLLRYRIHLGEFLRNYVTMDALFDEDSTAAFLSGVLRMDGKELHLCFPVESEAAHAALAGSSGCCVIYLKLVRPQEAGDRAICVVVTAGTIHGLYVGRNGVFYDRDGKNWDAVITKVVEANVSLAEAFWSPWRKIGEGISSVVTKFLGERQAKAVGIVQKSASAPSANGGGAALASAVAAIGIAVGMVGAGFASVAAVVRSMPPWQLAIAIVTIVLLVSLPSVILTWFRLRRRDLAAILNASGWAINHPIRFSMARACAFTKCARTSEWWFYALLTILILVLAGTAFWHFRCAFPVQDSTQTTTTEVSSK